MSELNDKRISRLRCIFRETIDWYLTVKEEGEPDDSYLYDMTVDMLLENHSRADFQALVENLLPNE